MNIEAATKHIQACRERMDALYLKPVFDEWVVVNFSQGKADVLTYHGQRADTFTKQLHRDSAPLFAEMQGKHYGVGDFEFVDQAAGSRFDACVRLGETFYLLCNNTFGTMAALRQDPRWREAQKPFVSLTDKFRFDPLQ
ncbi:MAG: hypothetical protein IPP19_14005 [Verrucomicrobia bacterium]|nr:hypothetical protein [Verrucomicrobiota bacterium]